TGTADTDAARKLGGKLLLGHADARPVSCRADPNAADAVRRPSVAVAAELASLLVLLVLLVSLLRPIWLSGPSLFLAAAPVPLSNRPSAGALVFGTVLQFDSLSLTAIFVDVDVTIGPDVDVDDSVDEHVSFVAAASVPVITVVD